MKVALCWLLCGIYGWGTTMAMTDYMNRHEWSVLNEHSRSNVGICAFVAICGPFGAIAIAFVSNFNERGWEIWEKSE